MYQNVPTCFCNLESFQWLHPRIPIRNEEGGKGEIERRKDVNGKEEMEEEKEGERREE